MTSRAEAIAAAAKAWATGMAATAYMSPREQAAAAWTPTSPYTVDQLEDLIRADRGLEPLDRTEPATTESVAETRKTA